MVMAGTRPVYKAELAGRELIVQLEIVFPPAVEFVVDDDVVVGSKPHKPPMRGIAAASGVAVVRRHHRGFASG
jgi:hypothetical protein